VTSFVFASPDKPRRELGTAFNAADVEEGWYEWWERQGYFRPRASEGKNEKACAIGIGQLIFSTVSRLVKEV
jgi:hypothetical protein